MHGAFRFARSLGVAFNTPPTSSTYSGLVLAAVSLA